MSDGGIGGGEMWVMQSEKNRGEREIVHVKHSERLLGTVSMDVILVDSSS